MTVAVRVTVESVAGKMWSRSNYCNGDFVSGVKSCVLSCYCCCCLLLLYLVVVAVLIPSWGDCGPRYVLGSRRLSMLMDCRWGGREREELKVLRSVEVEGWRWTD